MVKKIKKYAKFIVCVALIMGLIAPSYAALSASDGSAFVTKAEFDSALADFNARLTTFEAGINSKIDSQVTSYLDRNGIWNAAVQKIEPYTMVELGLTYDETNKGKLVMWKSFFSGVKYGTLGWEASQVRGQWPAEHSGAASGASAIAQKNMLGPAYQLWYNNYIGQIKAKDNSYEDKKIVNNVSKSGLLFFTYDWKVWTKWAGEADDGANTIFLTNMALLGNDGNLGSQWYEQYKMDFSVNTYLHQEPFSKGHYLCNINKMVQLPINQGLPNYGQQLDKQMVFVAKGQPLYMSQKLVSNITNNFYTFASAGGQWDKPEYVYAITNIEDIAVY